MRLDLFLIICVQLFFFLHVSPTLGNPPSISSNSGTKLFSQTPSTDKQPPFCAGAYADDLNVASPAARQKEQNTIYTYCIRSTATYQCLYYNSDGKVWKKRVTTSCHGTAFAYRHQKNSTLLLTNEHVAEWPFVTDYDNSNKDVPFGCKLINQSLSLVDNENDNYPLDDIKLQRVISDAELDVSVLRAPTRLPILPFRMGQSAALKAKNAIQVRGFPLAAFQATNVGKVINPHDRDQEKRWNHVDFVIDALLSSGHSGSPVLAVSCVNGDYELVGIYHAEYKGGSALNVAVGIDEFRELITTLQPRKKEVSIRVDLTETDREIITNAIKTGDFSPIIPYDDYTVGIRVHGSVLFYDFFSKKYPLLDKRLIIIEDVPAIGFGRVGRVWFGGDHGLKEYKFNDLEQTEQAFLERLVKSLHKQLYNVYRYRGYEAVAHKSRLAYDKMNQLNREISSGEPRRRELSNMLMEVTQNRAPGPNERTVTIKSTTSPTDSKTPPNPAQR